MKVTIDQLSEDQMNEIRKYMTELRYYNTVGNKVRYGYIIISAEVVGDPLNKSYTYKNVTFDIDHAGVRDDGFNERLQDQNKQVKDLSSMLTDIMIQGWRDRDNRY